MVYRRVIVRRMSLFSASGTAMFFMSASLMKTVLGPNDIRVYRSDDHPQNLLDSIRTGQPTVCPVEVGTHDEMICQMGDIAVRMGRKLQWDPVKEMFVNDEAANRKLSRVMRSPWRLEVPGVIGQKGA